MENTISETVLPTSIKTVDYESTDRPTSNVDIKRENKDIDDLLQADSTWTTALTGTVKLRRGQSGPSSAKPTTIQTVFQKTVKKWHNHLAMDVKRKGVSKQWTYQQYYEQSTQAAKSLIKLGLEPCHGVGILGFNAPEWCISYIGTIFAGGIATGIHTKNTPKECEYVLDDCRANIVVVENHAQFQKILKVWENLPNLKAIVQYTGEVAERREKIYSWEEFLDLSKDVDDEELQKRFMLQAPNTCCSLIYTSGTTGNPKGVMISHDNCTWTAEQTGNQLQYKDCTEITVTFLPLSHISAQMLDILMPLRFATSVYFAQPNALKGTLVDTLKEVRPTVLLAVPRVWEKIMEKIQGQAEAQREIRADIGLDRCRLTSSASAPIMRKILDYFAGLDIRIDERYGMSECSGPHTFCTDEAFRITSVGKELPGVQTKLDNSDENPDGEICFYGRHVFMGYLNQEEKTKEAIDDQGWLHSGDIGWKDQDGFLYIVGRMNEFIVTASGQKVAPVPIEGIVKEELACVSNCMLIGDKRQFLCMLITFKSDFNMDTHEPKSTLTPECQKWCKSIGSSATTVNEAKADQAVIKAIQAGIDKANDKPVYKAERIQKWAILEVDFSVSGGELGPTLKTRRQYVVKKYEKIIENFYAE